MKNRLIKKHVVVYDENKTIITQSNNNGETFVGEGRLFAEFDSEEDLNSFIVDNHLKDVKP